MSFKFLIKLIFAYVNKFKGVVLLGIILGVLLFFLIRIVAIFVISSKVERIGITGKYHTDTLPYEILRLIGNGLTKIDDTGVVYPDLAESWETPDKGKTWIFHLKKNLFWHDGTRLTSDSIVYEFSDVSVQKPDEYTIVFELKNPYTPFPSVVSRPTFKKGLLGTGEWVVKNIKLTGSFVKELVLENKSKEKKIYKFYPLIEQSKLAIKLGEVDEIVDVLDYSPFNEWKTLEVIPKTNTKQVVLIFFNTKDKFLSEKSLRQALNYAIDKDSLGVRAISPIEPNSWAYNPQVKEYKYDIERAKELLNSLPDKIKEGSEIKLFTNPLLLPIAEKISKDWEKIGIKSDIQVSPSIPEDYSAYLTIFDIPSDPDQYLLWHSTQDSTNISNFSSPRIDKLLEDGRVELELEKRRKIYLDFQRFLLEDLPAAFLYYPTYYTIKRK